MAVDAPNVVDAIGIENASGQIVLSIADHLDWRQLEEHLQTLQAKTDSYIMFLENGELAESYPQSVGRPIRIDVCCKYEPPAEAQPFLNKAREVAQSAGWSFSWRVINT